MTISKVEEQTVSTMSHENLNETKSGILVICAGSSNRLLQHFKTRKIDNVQQQRQECEACRMLADKTSNLQPRNKRLMMLQGKKFTTLPTLSENKNIVCQNNNNNIRHRCIHMNSAAPKVISAGNHTLQLSKTVKVSLYSKVTNPYLVIFDSTTKFAVPAGYLKLRKCRIITSQNEDDDDNTTFRIVANMSDDEITLQASNKTIRDEWVRCLSPLTQEQSLVSKHQSSSFLPILEEAEEPNEQQELQSESLKAPSRRQRIREGRRSSLPRSGALFQRRSQIVMFCPKA